MLVHPADRVDLCPLPPRSSSFFNQCVTGSSWTPARPARRTRGRPLTISGRPVDVTRGGGLPSAHWHYWYGLRLKASPLAVQVAPPLDRSFFARCLLGVSWTPDMRRRSWPLASLVVDLYRTIVLEGLLLRGIC